MSLLVLLYPILFVRLEINYGIHFLDLPTHVAVAESQI